MFPSFIGRKKKRRTKKKSKNFRKKKTKKKKKKKKKKKMDIVPGTADSFSSKASKKSKTRDWEKTK